MFKKLKMKAAARRVENKKFSGESSPENMVGRACGQLYAHRSSLLRA